MTNNTDPVRALAELAERAVPFLRDEAAKYDDDGSNEPLELAREIETALASLPSDESALSSASSAFDGGREAPCPHAREVDCDCANPPALASAPPSAPDRMAIRMLVAAGFVTDAKANEALQIAHGFISGPLEPPSAPVGVGEVRPDYRPAFDLPTTAAEALAWLTQQGDPTCMTFSPAKAKRAAELLGAALQQTETDPVTAAAIAELNRAVQKFPTWPTDPLHAVAVLGEEFGELTKAVLQSVYEPHKVTPGDVQTEAVQVAAMALRFLRSLHSYEFTPGAQHEQPALSKQPAAPSGDAVAWLRMKPDGTPDWAEDCIGSLRRAPAARGRGWDGMVMVQASDLKTLAEFADRGMRGNPAKLAALRAQAILAANRQEGE